MAALLAAAAAPAQAQQAPAAAVPGSDALEAAAERLVRDRLTAGLQVCVRKQGRTVVSRGFGFANLEHGAAMTPASVCRVASVTKTFTAALVLLLAEEGRLSLDDTLERRRASRKAGGSPCASCSTTPPACGTSPTRTTSAACSIARAATTPTTSCSP
jgi:beta-lactamase class A